MFSFIETRAFTKLVLEYLTDAEYAALQSALIADPEAGPVIPGSGGVRKLRWAAPGRGKRGGYRVIYYVLRPARERDHLDADDVPEERSR
jgi:mRNA-degrading endonuclease RelE of RelBE toxin-antitoxin system